MATDSIVISDPETDAYGYATFDRRRGGTIEPVRFDSPTSDPAAFARMALRAGDVLDEMEAAQKARLGRPRKERADAP